MLSQALEDLAAALAERAGSAPDPERREVAERLRRHVGDYLIPRAANLTAPLVVVVLGSTGAGKSSLFNAIAGKPASRSGLLRPTTRRPVALVHPEDGPFPGPGKLLPGLSGRNSLDVVVDEMAAPGLVIVDSPDFDSVELANRELALELLEAADLVIFITTVTRYADQVPWAVLARAHQRGVPLVAVINRMPSDPVEAEEVLADFRALSERAALDQQGAFGQLEVVSVSEGSVDRGSDSLTRDAVAPILNVISRLRLDQEERKLMARASLDRALAGLPAAVKEIANEHEGEEKVAAYLIGVLTDRYRLARKVLDREIDSGTFLRSEVLRQWLDFVRAGPFARFLAEGVGRIAANLRNLVRPAPPGPVIDVKEQAFSDLVVSSVRYADEAAATVAASWAEDPHGARALSTDPGLWGSSSDLGPHLHTALTRWGEDIADEIRVIGEQRRGWAKVATVGLNVLGTSAMLAVFVHTGGLTGAELGIGAATAVVNQKLLEAIFGEANVSAFVNRARARLGEILDSTYRNEQQRFLVGLGAMATPTDLAGRMRRAAVLAAKSDNAKGSMR